jgi:putative phage-type endonuclease
MSIDHRPITDRAEWLEWRRKYLGASDVAAAAGVDPYRSPMRLFAEKTGLVPDIVENAAMTRGRHFESAALAYLAEEKPGWTIERPNVYITDDVHRLACTPDALAKVDGELVCVQIKTINRFSFDKWNGHAPLGYRLQVVCENMLAGADRGILAVLVVSAYDAELKLFDVPRHEAAERAIRQLALEFWDRVASGRRPDPDYNKDADVIAALFPRQEPGTVLDLSGDNRLAEILPRREDLKDTIDGARKELDALDAEVKHKLGDAEAATLPGWRLSWKSEHRNEYTVAASDRRVLRVKQIEDKEQAA